LIELFRTSTFRLVVLYTGLFAVSVFAVLAFIYWQTVVYSGRQTGETIDAEITGLAEQYRRAGLVGLVEVIAERSDASHGSNMLYLLTDSSGRPMAGNLTRWPDAHVDPDGWTRFTLHTPAVDGKGERDHVVQAESFLLPGGFQLLVGRDLAERDQFRDRISAALAWSAAMTLILGLAGGVLMSRGVLRRLESINRTSDRIMAGEISRRIPLTGRNDEFDRLAQNLNTMLDRIQRLMDGMRQVTDNIAHDLRSPLGRLRSRIEVALLDPPSEERYRAELERTIEDADTLLLTFNALLDIAQAEAGNPRAEMIPLDMVGLARDLIDLYEPVAEEAGLKLDAWLPEAPISLNGYRHLLSQAIANLIENALKYTPSGGTVRVTVERVGEAAQLVIADTGPGIPEAERDRVFDRFYRLEASRTTPGNGLGLSLTRAVFHLHGGTIAMTDDRPGEIPPGLRITVSLPLATETPGNDGSRILTATVTGQ
jgi:signal transduction histidine kinase